MDAHRNVRTEGGFVNRMRMIKVPTCLAGLIFAATLPLMAQLPPAVGPGLPVPANTPKPAETPSLANEPVGWLAALVRINTTNPPGNERAPPNYVPRILLKEGIPSQSLHLTPGRPSL